MRMSFLEPEAVTPREKQKLLKVHLKSLRLKACDTWTWHLVIDFILYSHGEHGSLYAQTP